MPEFAAPQTREDAHSARATAAGVRYLLLFVVGTFLGGMAALEARTSAFQARMLSSIAGSATYEVLPGKNHSLLFPRTGPYNERLGYTRLGEAVSRLEARDYVVASQARHSAGMRSLSGLGVSPIYREKARAGLRIVDGRGRTFFAAAYPEKSFESFEAIPRVVMETLLYVENRDLMTPGDPRRNPAVEWPRLAKAAFAYGAEIFDPGRAIPGGSTLATQMEKFRHSFGGVTSSPTEKLRQMATASLRSYRYGIDTSRARRELIADYINSISLAARPGHGEVFGLSMGLALWYGADVDRVRELLVQPEVPGTDLEPKARAYKQVLTLLLAARRPSFYLVENPEALGERADLYLRLLAEEGVISARLRDAALGVRLDPGSLALDVDAVAAGDRASSRQVRTTLLSLLGLPSFYELDRMDLTVRQTVAERRQRAVEEILRSAQDPSRARALGLTGERLLDNGDPSNIVYAFSLYERGADYNRLRLQVDTLDGALDANEDVKLDLGSTAKLRTMATYLEVMAGLHERFARRDPERLARIAVDENDVLTAWAVERLRRHPGESREAFLEAAVERRYSADPDERFFTGGGIHRFHNFDEDDDGRTMSMARAFRHSVNLPFIRLMRDIVDHYTYGQTRSANEILSDPDHWARDYYLRRFADRESRLFLGRFYRKYRGKDPETALETLVRGRYMTPRRYTVILRAARPDLSKDEVIGRVAQRFESSERWAPEIDAEVLETLYTDSAPGRFNAIELGHLTKLHPLEVWLVGFLTENPDATFDDALRVSKEHRVVSYRWLIATKKKHHQDRRISSELEIDAFAEIHKLWRRHGYPFPNLVPSYATAIGSSADRPSALAELLGIILNDGVRRPAVRLEELRFAEGTPFETNLVPAAGRGDRVMSPAVAATLRKLMFDTVSDGTARRAGDAIFGVNGETVPVGGKTGTGDHVFKVVDSDGEIVKSHVISRSATFAFIIGDRFYGVLSAYVKGEEAADYTFTSSLATQVFKMIGPALMPLFEGGDEAVLAGRGAFVATGEKPVPSVVPLAHPVFRIAPRLLDEDVPQTAFELALCSNREDAGPAIAVPPSSGVLCDGESPITPHRSGVGVIAEEDLVVPQPGGAVRGQQAPAEPVDDVAVPADLV